MKDYFNEMKVVKSDADQMERLRIVVFWINDKFIEVEKAFREKDLQGQDTFKVFQSQLVSKTCRYLLYDCHFESKESSKKEELVFVLWCPDDAPVKEKMKYASSATAIRKTLDGAKHNLEIHDPADCADKITFGEQLEKGIQSMEGHPCC